MRKPVIDEFVHFQVSIILLTMDSRVMVVGKAIDLLLGTHCSRCDFRLSGKMPLLHEICNKSI